MSYGHDSARLWYALKGQLVVPRVSIGNLVILSFIGAYDVMTDSQWLAWGTIGLCLCVVADQIIQKARWWQIERRTRHQLHQLLSTQGLVALDALRWQEPSGDFVLSWSWRSQFDDERAVRHMLSSRAFPLKLRIEFPEVTFEMVQVDMRPTSPDVETGDRSFDSKYRASGDVHTIRAMLTEHVRHLILSSKYQIEIDKGCLIGWTIHRPDKCLEHISELRALAHALKGQRRWIPTLIEYTFHAETHPGARSLQLLSWLEMVGPDVVDVDAYRDEPWCALALSARTGDLNARLDAIEGIMDNLSDEALLPQNRPLFLARALEDAMRPAASPSCRARQRIVLQRLLEHPRFVWTATRLLRRLREQYDGWPAE
ncbi:MAG: hypothetical protein ACE366_18410 [Bradymonadia bacterium]